MGTMVISSGNEEQGFSQAKEVKAVEDWLRHIKITLVSMCSDPVGTDLSCEIVIVFLNIKAKTKHVGAHFRALSEVFGYRSKYRDGY